MRPRLIHPQLITAQVSTGNAPDDPVFREPVGRSSSRMKTITFKAQVAFRASGSPSGEDKQFDTLMGNAKGYLIARPGSSADLLTKGSKITAFNSVPCKLSVLRVDPAGFDQGKHTLLYIPFEEDNT